MLEQRKICFVTDSPLAPPHYLFLSWNLAHHLTLPYLTAAIHSPCCTGAGALSAGTGNDGDVSQDPASSSNSSSSNNNSSNRQRPAHHGPRNQRGEWQTTTHPGRRHLSHQQVLAPAESCDSTGCPAPFPLTPASSGRLKLPSFVTPSLPSFFTPLLRPPYHRSTSNTHASLQHPSFSNVCRPDHLLGATRLVSVHPLEPN